MVGFLNVMTGVIRAGSSGQAWVWNGMTSYLPTHPANSSATIDELELLLTGGRLAAPARADALALLVARQSALQRVLSRAVQAQAQRVDHLALRLGQPARAVLGQRERLNGLAHRLQQALAQRRARHADEPARLWSRLQRAQQTQRQRCELRLGAAQERLQALDPHRVLQRGYAWVEAADGRPVVSARALQAGQSVRAVWSDGHAQAQIVQVQVLPSPVAGD
jgi:exodeoxyribonuclease VII large subunit